MSEAQTSDDLSFGTGGVKLIHNRELDSLWFVGAPLNTLRWLEILDFCDLIRTSYQICGPRS